MRKQQRKYHHKDKRFWRRARPDGTFGDDWWTSIGGKRVSTKTNDIEAARAFRTRRERLRADPRFARAEETSLSDAVKALYAELRRRGRSAATQEIARQKLGHFPRLWGKDCKLVEIDAEKVDAYVDTRMAEGATRLTIRDERGYLRQALKLQKRYGKWPYAIEDVFPLFETGHKPRKDSVSQEDLPKLLARVIPRHAAHILFFVITAGRKSDAERAEPGDFDLVTWMVKVRGTKTEGSDRTIPILPHLRAFAVQLIEFAKPDDSYLPSSALAPPDGKLFVPWSNINRDLELACERAEIPKVTTNGLRRTFGKLARQHGYTLDTISKLFGHTTAKLVRDVYADVEGEELRIVVDREHAAAKVAARTETVQQNQKQETKADDVRN